MLVSKTLPHDVAFLVFDPQSLQFVLIPPESPPPFQSTKIVVNMNLIMCFFHKFTSEISNYTGAVSLNLQTILLGK
ncbi:hypothetical protein [Paenisporosarcina quisquiliarum]|uniref:hypothetical protein n=1 Tax=Paenisporosarcina quisquiliarum TaxID=365346 RepID=UPI003736CDBC